MTEITAAQWLAVAAAAAGGSDCSRRNVGAVLVSHGRGIPLSVGYIITPQGTSCLGGDCPRGRKSLAEQPAYAPYDDCISQHAETVAVQRALTVWGPMSLLHATLYITDRPCHDCAVALKELLIEVVWPGKD